MLRAELPVHRNKTRFGSVNTVASFRLRITPPAIEEPAGDGCCSRSREKQKSDWLYADSDQQNKAGRRQAHLRKTEQ